MSVELRELLRFYAEAGVDEALDEAPRDRFAEFAAQQNRPAAARRAPEPARPAVAAQANGQAAGARAPAQPPRPAATSVAVPDEGQVLLARELAERAGTLDDLRAAMAGFEGCNLRHTAKSLVFADGNPAGPLMLVGEAPGRDEDIEGCPSSAVPDSCSTAC